MRLTRLLVPITLALGCAESLPSGVSATEPPPQQASLATLRVDLLGMSAPLVAGAQAGRVGLRLCTRLGCGEETVRTLSTEPVTDLSLAAGSYAVRLITPPSGYVSSGVFADEALMMPLAAGHTVVAVFQVAPPDGE